MNMQELATSSSATIQHVFLRAAASRMLANSTDGEEEDVDPLSPQGIWDALNAAMPSWAVWIVLIGGSFFLCFLMAMCTCCVMSRRRKIRQRLSKNSSLSKYNNNNGSSVRTMTKRIDGTPSRALGKSRKFKSRGQPTNFVRMSDANDDFDQVSPSNDAYQSPSNRPVSRRIPESYGRVDEETAKRIQSIRMSVNIKPILAQQQPPNAKALRMMGITEDQSKKNFDETIQQRMKRIAAGAGGGVYSPGFATAGFGSSVVEGFATLRAKKEKKAAAKRLTHTASAPEFQSIKLKSTKSFNATDTNQTRPRTSSLNPGGPKLQNFLARKESGGSADTDAKMSSPPSVGARTPTKSVYGAEVDALKPGGNKMAAFLNTTAAAASVDDAEDYDSERDDIDGIL